MIRVISFLWSGCWHKWETENKGRIISSDGKGYVGDYVNLRCGKCGDWKCRNLK